MGESDEKSYMVWVILAVVGIVLLITIANSIRVSLNKNFDEQSCWQSIEKHSQLVSLSNRDIEPDIECPTRVDKIPEKQKDIELYSRIAADWVRCWKEWHRGEAELFSKSGSYCHVCQIYSFEKPENLKMNELNVYLETTKMGALAAKHPSIAGTLIQYENMTVKEYLTPFLEMNEMELDQEVIDKANREVNQQSLGEAYEANPEDFAIIILYAKGQSEISDILAGRRFMIGQVGTGLVIAGIALPGLQAALTLSFVPGPGWIAAGAVLLGTGIFLAYESITGGGDSDAFAASVFKPYDERTIVNLGCEVFPVKQK